MRGGKEVLVSVIMPIYNAEEFLRETLDTVINQTLRELEIICVDDGSSDNTQDILGEYASADERISILKQQNQYAGVARNNGLARATGKYVIFWDADDLFELDALEKMYNRAEEDEADICVCGANQLDSETNEVIKRGVYLITKWIPEETPFSKVEAGDYIFNFAANVPWNKMYLRQFVNDNNLQFQELKQVNDAYFVMMAMYLAKKITYVNQALVTYRINNDRSLTGKASDTAFCLYDAYVKTLDTLMKDEVFKQDKYGTRHSFDKRSIAGFCLSLYSQRDFMTFKKLYEMLKMQGLGKFGLLDKSEEYFHNKKHYEDLQKILKLEPEQFLFCNLREAKYELLITKSRTASRNKEQTKIIKEQQVILDSLAVRTALKAKKILTFNERLRYKK